MKRLFYQDDLKFAEYRQGDLGPLRERRWEVDIGWKKPEKESTPCWFLTNAGVEDQEAEPKFVFRSLAMLRLHLKAARVATTQKIKQEHENRMQKNLEAVAVLEANFKMWNLVAGPFPGYLKDPSEEALHYAYEAKRHLERIRDEQRDAPDNAAAIAGECVRAAESLASLQMESIRRERFPMTPQMLFEGLVRNLNDLQKCTDAESLRREHWLSSEGADMDETVRPAAFAHGDIFGCDPDVYSRPTNLQRKPKYWKKTVQQASLVPVEFRNFLRMSALQQIMFRHPFATFMLG